MIHIEQNQQLKDEAAMRAAVPTGDYNETDLIECYRDGEDPNVPTGMYQAQYVVLGRAIYHQSEELSEEQVAALLANKPADEVINNRRMIDGKRPAAKYVGRIVRRRGGPGRRDLRTDLTAEQQATSTQATSTPKIVRPDDQIDTATTTPAVATTTPATTATTTPATTATTTPQTSATTTPIIDTGTASTTPAATTTPAVSTSTPDISQDILNVGTATTTPDAILPAATTTPAIDAGTASTTPAAASSTEVSSIKKDMIALAKKSIARRLKL